MNLRVYSIYDKKSRTFEAPFTMPKDAMAIREITQFIRRSPNGNLAQFAEDYQLMLIGQFDVETGLLVDNGNVLVAELSEILPRDLMFDTETPRLEKTTEEIAVERARLH